MGKAGRPSTYTPEKGEAVCAAVAAGATFRLAGAVVGVTGDTVTHWRRKHPDFATRLLEAEGQAVVKHLARIEAAAADDWRAAAWLLERRHPNDYGPKQTLEHAGPGGGPIEFAGIDVPLPPRADDPEEPA